MWGGCFDQGSHSDLRRLPGGHREPDFSALSERNQIRRTAGSNQSWSVRNRQPLRGIMRRKPERCLQRNARKFHDVAYSAIQCEYAAGKFALVLAAAIAH